MSTLADFRVQTLDGKDVSLGDYSGKVVLVVNVASACGNTPQYAGLQELYREFAPRGFVVLGFPCNQFGEQEPGSAAEIAEFCSLEYRVTFPMFAKIEVNGAGADPVYKWLRSETPDSNDRDVEWNFVKFLIGRDGKPAMRYGDKVEPADLRSDIEKFLA
ncbi:MAG: glutathione peroxidase [Hyphomicrobiaceae bacterium]|nr:glutathione peroxidase [Hyphomicrobiaceae bacterium]